MLANTQPIDEALFFWSWFSRWRRRGVLRHLFHLLSQAERPHVRPYFLNVSKALCLGPDFSDIIPSQRILSIFRPDGILLLVIDYNFVDGFVFIFRVLQ